MRRSQAGGKLVVAAGDAEQVGALHAAQVRRPVHEVVEVRPELHRLGWFVFQSGVFRWDGGGGVVVLGH